MSRLRRAPIAVMLVALLWVGSGSNAAAEDLVAVDGAGFAATSLYTIDPATGAIISVIGPTGYAHLNAIDFDPTTGFTVLYGIVNDLELLVTFDLTTGMGSAGIPITDAGGMPLTLDGCDANFSDMTFNSSGVIYAIRPCTNEIYSIDKVTGIATPVLDCDAIFVFIYAAGLAFDSTDTLWVKNGDALFMVDVITPMFFSAHCSYYTD